MTPLVDFFIGLLANSIVTGSVVLISHVYHQKKHQDILGIIDKKINELRG